MPRGPRGERRPADAVGAAILVGRIATGDAEDPKGKTPNRAKGGKAGARARADKLSPERRKEIAANAAKKRWKSGSKTK